MQEFCVYCLLVVADLLEADQLCFDAVNSVSLQMKNHARQMTNKTKKRRKKKRETHVIIHAGT